MLPRPDEGPGAQLYYPLPCSLSEPELDQLLHRELGAGLDVDPDTSVTPGLTKAEALAMIGQADRARGAQQERVAAIITVMLFTGARVSEVCGADIEDLGVDRGHRELWVTRKGGKRQALALPAPATERLDIYLATRADVTAVPAIPGQEGASPARRVLFTTASGARMFAADVWRLVRRIAKAAGLHAELTLTCARMRCDTVSRRCTNEQSCI